jgi:hypothetical protein
VSSDNRKWIGEYGTPDAFVTDSKTGCYKSARYIFAIILDDTKDVASCLPLVLPAGGHNLSIVPKTRFAPVGRLEAKGLDAGARGSYSLP